MPVTYTTAVKNARLSAVVTAIGGTGVLELGTAGMATIIASFPLSATAGTVANAVLTFSGFPKTVTAGNAGTPVAARVRTATGGTDILTGLTVGTSNTDVVLDAPTATAGQSVRIDSFTISTP